MNTTVMLVSIVLVLSGNVLAQGGLDIFTKTGFRQCESDCSLAAVSAEMNANAEASAQCAPAQARQVSKWTVNVRGYGRLYATAAFLCDTNMTSEQ